MKRKTAVRGVSLILAFVLALGMGITALADRQATVKGSGVNIRSGPGTNYDPPVASKGGGTALIVTGEEQGSDGHTWYKVTFDGDKEGYIRDDFIELGEEIPSEEPVEEAPEETAPAEESPDAGASMADTMVPEEPAPVTNNDYTVEYAENEDGEFSWYLNNNIEGVRYKVEELLETAQSAVQYRAETEGRAARDRILLIVLGVLLVAAIIAITILILRLRGAYEEIEEEQYRSQSARRRESGGAPQRSSSASRTGGSRPAASSQQSIRTTSSQGGGSRSGVRTESRNAQSAGRAGREMRYQEERPQAPVRKPAPRPRNFAGDMDDDFEYNFVDLDDD